ncbi:cellulose biosynthesis protein BcsG [Burkholderia sp. WAC0059]|uniref:cellulose biosynthesis protein BcsG n=1 Tax=Burkholderia sp. WAC0059 TaxID=2066022 RepID=UPI000C7F1976|nr:cellulose biosynthesis protein BcsG [Burkholderia sp. WAC0059]PLZ03111.1 cellulose biosynthesis protein BcsG [Burkholderia sp. WAC0059]
MGLWNLYFAAKLYLFAVGKLQPVWWMNIAFALALLAPIRQRWLRVGWRVLSVFAGIALLYHEANVPTIGRVIQQLPALASFTPRYMLELMGRVIPMSTVYTVALVVVAYFVISRWVRITTFVMIALVVAPLWQGIGTLAANAGSVAANNAGQGGGGNSADGNATGNGTGGSFDAQLAAFRSSEAGRTVTFEPPKTPTTPDTQYDIIVIHVCSLSWDDLDVVNARNNPLFSRFDYVFTNFSGAASYSGPAAIRVLRATCGQEAHRDLYSPAPQQCHLFADLAQLGFTPQALLNHNGQFDDFRGIVEREIGVPGVKLLPNDGLPVTMREFDNSPLVGDYAVLSRWYQQRLAAGGGPVALYYNTVTLHDGNRIPGNNMNSLQSYPIRLQMLLGDIDKLIDLVQNSGRKAVLIFVPEHGAALRGDPNQIAGMREIPTPRIVHLPVGVTLIGLPKPAGGAPHTPITIDTPTSYLALAQLLANLVANNPFAPNAPPLAQYAQSLPQTRLVGENESTVTLTTANGYEIHTADGVWVEGK